ncbi:YqeG family HAD IIIA-type phosphatase [Brevibacillus reuszeri]|uniref:YqeG family HAD IIIA-type phosphatase n=1 Tax=Brevibacillus reuszeri TaxID=54915 RepID=UPI0023EADAE4|nr:YqeG family HAD IIIA-type phosphatase [Brevibacillus reuszeri]
MLIQCALADSEPASQIIHRKFHALVSDLFNKTFHDPVFYVNQPPDNYSGENYLNKSSFLSTSILLKQFPERKGLLCFFFCNRVVDYGIVGAEIAVDCFTSFGGAPVFLKKLMPSQFVESIHHIDIDQLKRNKVRAVITDLDNTLVEWDRPLATPEVENWLKRLHEADIQVTVVSNNNKERVDRFCSPLDIGFICSARKPTNRAFLQAVRQMNVTIAETVVIGDQLFTDVLGGNRLGFHTILVVPVAQTDGFWTRFNRQLERVALIWMERKGMVSWRRKA